MISIRSVFELARPTEIIQNSVGVLFDSHRPLQKTKRLGRCLIFHFFQISANPCFFFKKCRSRFSGRISQALQTSELNRFFEDSIPGRRQDRKPARLQMQDSTSDISCTAPGGRRFKSTLRADRCFSRTTVLKNAVWIDAKHENQFLQADWTVPIPLSQPGLLPGRPYARNPRLHAVLGPDCGLRSENRDYAILHRCS